MRKRIGAEHRQWNSGHADFFCQPLAETDIIQIGNGAVVSQQEVRPFGRQNFQAALSQCGHKQIPACTVKIRQVAIMLWFIA